MDGSRGQLAWMLLSVKNKTMKIVAAGEVTKPRASHSHTLIYTRLLSCRRSTDRWCKNERRAVVLVAPFRVTPAEWAHATWVG